MFTSEADTLSKTDMKPGVGSFYITGGTLPYDAASYVPRQADHDLLAGLNSGEFCYVLNTRQMGKSSLMIRTAHHLRQQGNTVAVLDLTAVGQNLTPDQWYDGLLMSLAEQLGLEDPLEDFWNDSAHLGPLQRFMTALGKIVLPTIAKRLVVFVDEIDAVRSLPFPADEFFAAIRECYNRRQTDPIYEKLAFCLLGVATPADLIVDTRMSPFNIGRRIQLTDFAPNEAGPLARGMVGGQPVLDRVLHWAGGHPYMTQRLCRAIAEEPEIVTPAQVDALCARLFLTKQARDTDDNLAFVRNRLLRSEVDLAALLDLYTQVRAGRKVKDDETNPLVPVLRLSGVVAAQQGQLKLRNRIYDRVFDKEWVQSHMPHAELRRQQAAFRRGALRTATLASVVLLLMGILSAWALSENHAAQASARTAKQALKETQDALAAEQIAERQEQTQEKRADKKANEASRAKQVAEKAAQHEKAANSLAHLRLLETERQTKVANDQTKVANDQTKVANDQTDAALDAQAQAEREKTAAQEAQKEAVTAKKNTQNLLQVASLQLAQQTWNSDTGTAAAVRDQLDASRTAPRRDGQERFEWRCQWAMLHGTAIRSRRPGGCQIGLTPNGRTVVLDSANRLHRVTSSRGQVPEEVNLGALAPVVAAALSPDGAQVALGTRDGKIEVRDTQTLAKIAAWQGSPQMTALSFQKNGQEVEAVYAGDGVRVWEARTGQLRRRWSEEEYQASGGHWIGSWFSHDAWSEDRRCRAVAHDDQQIWVSDMERLQENHYTPLVLAMPAEVASLAISPDGRRLAAGDSSGAVTLWNIAEGGKKESVLPQRALDASGTDNPTVALAFSPDGTRLAVGSGNGLIRVFPLGTEQTAPPLILKGHAAAVASLRFSANGQRLASSDEDGMARVWDVAPQPTDLPQLASGAALTSVSFSPNSALLGCVGSDGSAALWNTETKDSQLLPKADNCQIDSIAFAPNGRTAAYSGRKGAENFIQLWNPITGQPGKRWEVALDTTDIKKESTRQTLAFSPDSRLLAGNGGQVWSAATGQVVHPAPQFDSPVNAQCFAAGGRYLILACRSGTVHCLETQHWTEVRRLVLGQEALCLAASPDGKRLAIGDAAGRILLCAAEGGAGRFLTEVTGRVCGVAFSPDGLSLASVSRDRSVTLWDAATGLRTGTLSAFDSGCDSVAFAPDGSALVSGKENGTVQTWPAASPARIRAWSAFGEHAAALQTTAWTTLAMQQAKREALIHEIGAGQIRPDGAVRPVRAVNQITALALSTSEGGFAAARTENGALRLDVRAEGPHSWDVELTQDHLNLENGRSYILQFLARADRKMPLGIQFQRDIPNHDDVGNIPFFSLAPEWRPYRFQFQAKNATPYHTHLMLIPKRGTLWLKNPLLTELPDSDTAGDSGSALSDKQFFSQNTLLPALGRNLIGPNSLWQVWIDPGDGPAANWNLTPGDALTLNVTRVDGTDWHIQIAHKNLPLQAGKAYTLQFRARADQPQFIRLNTQMSNSPYTHNGLEDSILLTAQWRAYRFHFVMQKTPGPSELSLCAGQCVNHLLFADAQLISDDTPQENHSKEEISQ